MSTSRRFSKMKISSRSSTTAKTTTAIHAPPGAASPDDPALARLLGHPAEQGQAPARQVHAAPAGHAGRAVLALWRPPADRRSATQLPRAVGTMVAARHPKGNSRQLP